MPGLGVGRADSTRSDRSDESKGSSGGGKKVYKNRHNQRPPNIPEENHSPPPSPQHTITYRVHASPLTSRYRYDAKRRPDSPQVRRNHVKKIVQKFNLEAAKRREDIAMDRSPYNNMTPPPSPPPGFERPSTLEIERPVVVTPVQNNNTKATPKKSTGGIMNGVRNFLGGTLRRTQSNKSTRPVLSSTNGHIPGRNGKSATLTKRTTSPTYDSSYEDDSSPDELNNNGFRGHDEVDNAPPVETRDIAVQVKPGFPGTYTIIPNGSAYNPSNSNNYPLYSQVDKNRKKRMTPSEYLYGESPRYEAPTFSSAEYRAPSPFSAAHYNTIPQDNKSTGSESPSMNRYLAPSENDSAIHNNVKVKTSSRSFGFNIGQKNKQRSKKPKDRNSVEDESEVSSVASDPHSRPNSVLRGLDPKKKELSYENISRAYDRDTSASQPVSPTALWVRDANEDYRKEMAYNEVAVPANQAVTTNPNPNEYVWTYSASLGRGNKNKTKKIPSSRSPSPTRNSRLGFKSVEPRSSNSAASVASSTINNKKAISGSTDQLYSSRGGLANAYQSRQLYKNRYGGSQTRLPNRSNGSSAGSSSGSVAASEPARTRETIVMYIPGVSHHNRTIPEEPNRSQTIARSHSMYQKPKDGGAATMDHRSALANGGYIKSSRPSTNTHFVSRARSDTGVPVQRSKSIPRNTKFPWIRK